MKKRCNWRTTSCTTGGTSRPRSFRKGGARPWRPYLRGDLFQGGAREILVAWHAGSFEMVVSPKLLYELQEVLSRDKFRRYLSIRDVGEYVLWIDDGATAATDPETGASSITRDPRDDYLAALALYEGADFLVSVDSHLLDLKQDTTSEVGGQVRMLTPREFLGELELLG